MTKDLMSTFVCELETDDAMGIENSYEKIYRVILEAFTNDTAAETRKQLSVLCEKMEQIEEELEDPQDEKWIRTYYLGRVQALTELLTDVGRSEEVTRESQQLFQRHRYLKACLEIIDQYPRITGKELRQRLEIERPNTLSNFMKRIESYQLLHVQRLGNTNYYMLSPKGRQYLQENQNTGRSKGVVYDEKFVLLLLETIANEFKSDRPVAARVVSQVNLRSGGSTVRGNSLILRQYIEQIFKARAYGLKKVLLPDRDYQQKETVYRAYYKANIVRERRRLDSYELGMEDNY